MFHVYRHEEKTGDGIFNKPAKDDFHSPGFRSRPQSPLVMRGTALHPSLQSLGAARAPGSPGVLPHPFLLVLSPWGSGVKGWSLPDTPLSRRNGTENEAK